jgi:fructokinase
MGLPLWVLGEALMDGVVQPDGRLQLLPGGSPFNLALAAAQQGWDVGYLNPLSHDGFGQALTTRLVQTGVQALGKTSRKPTSLAVVNLQEGQASYGFYRDGVADRDYAADDLVRRMKAQTPGVLHTGSLMAMPPEHRRVMHVIQFAKALGWTISIDVNLRTQVADDLPAYLQAVTEMAALADWLKASDEDMVALGWADVHWDHTETLAQRWLAMGCQRVALTFGEQGASLHVGDLSAKAAPPAVKLVDTVGAGDTFWGSCLADWLMHDTLGHDDAAAQRIEKTLQRALKAAAINCERVGCQPPSREELEHALARGSTSKV